MSKFNDFFGRAFRGKRLSMLGLKASGKSQFLKSLGCSDALPGVQSSREEYDWFKVDLHKKTVFVKAGYDIGGGHEYFMSQFNNALKQGSWVLFLIDIKAFLENGADPESGSPYRDVVFQRLDYINENVPNKYFDKVAIVLTHADLLKESREYMVNEFQRAAKSKIFSVLTKRCFAVNATEPKDVLCVFERIIQ